MTQPLNSVPPIKDEIYRKTLDTLDWLNVEHLRGVITDGEFSIALTAVYQSLSGMFKDIEEAITEIQKTLKPKRIEVYQSRHDYVITIADRERDNLTVITAKSAKYQTIDLEFRTDIEAGLHRLSKKVGQKFIDKGFDKIK